MSRLVRRSALAAVIWALSSFESTARAEPACVTTCAGALLDEDGRTAATAVEPTLRAIRSCLAGVRGGDAVRPSVLVISEGREVARTVRVIEIEAGGYEKLACMPRIASLHGRLGATEMLRCELRCEGEPPASPSKSDLPPTTPEPQRQAQVWYGWQTLLADGSALALWLGAVAAAAGGSSDEAGAIAGGGAFVYFLAPPIVHLAHGRLGPAFGSLGMRVLAPPILALIGGIAGAVIDPNKGGEIGSDGLAAGLILGLVAGYASVVAIDAALLSYEKVETSDKSPPVRKPQAIRALPSLVLAPTPYGGLVGAGGVTGTF